MNSAATSQVSETFLVLEDNVLLALDAAASVTAAGYDVVMTARGGEALAMMRTQALCGAILDFEVLDGNSLHVARRLMQEEGILCGISCGAAMHAAVRLAEKPEMQGKTIVVVLPDSGERYLSSMLFSDLFTERELTQ